MHHHYFSAFLNLQLYGGCEKDLLVLTFEIITLRPTV